MSEKKESVNAIASLVGYILPIVYLLYCMEKKKGSTYSIETISDISFETIDGKVSLVEAKVILDSTKNPRSIFASNSTDFWKTLKNWIDFLSSETEMKDYAFILYINSSSVQNIKADAEKLFDKDKRLENIIDLRSAVDSILANPNLSDNQRKIMGIKKFVLSLEVTGHLNYILDNINIEHESYDDLLGNLREEYYKNHGKYANALLTQLIGWIHGEIIMNAELGSIVAFTDEEYVSKKVEIVNDRSGEDSPFTDIIDFDETLVIEADELAEMKKDYVYLRQLEIIDIDEDAELLRAIIDKMNYKTNVENWVDLKILQPNDRMLKKFHKSINDAFRNAKRTNGIEYKDNSLEEQGQLLYGRILNMRRFRVGKYKIDNTISNGYLHSQSDKLEIGWHPNYIDYFSKDVEDD